MLDYNVVVDPSRYLQFTDSVVAPGTQNTAAQLLQQFNTPTSLTVDASEEITSSSVVTTVNLSPSPSPPSSFSSPVQPNVTPAFPCGSTSSPMKDSSVIYPQASPFGPATYSPIAPQSSFFSSPSTFSQLSPSPSPKPPPMVSAPVGQLSFAPHSPVSEAKEALTPLPGEMMSTINAWLDQKPGQLQTRVAPYLSASSSTPMPQISSDDGYPQSSSASGEVFAAPQLLHA